MLRFGFEDGCHEHIPLVKSGELRLPVNSPKKECWLRGLFHIGHDYTTFFSADITQAKNGELLNVAYFTHLKGTYTLFMFGVYTKLIYKVWFQATGV